ncbi:hypothetical protein ACFV0T_39110 [Streptomyces sp. NPDC059582]|uniref:hypothetical protein n=1 Tax=Streptomyces sp. NPDC059582 TaxID=3346875 RepID=UPI0036738F84
MPQLPGTARCARALLVVVGMAGVVALSWLIVAAVTLRTGALGELILGMMAVAATICAALAAVSFVLAGKFAAGSNTVRVGTVVVGWVILVGGAVAALAGQGMWGGAGVAVGALLAFLSTTEPTRDWFGA